MAELLCEFSGQREDGVGHSFVISVGVGQAPFGEKLPVHILPHAVGVDQRAVHIK